MTQNSQDQISTALLNFSNRDAEIHVGEKFFRVLFLQHDDVSEFPPPQNERINKQEYIRELERKAHRDFPRTYLNIPSSGAESLYRNFWKSLWYGLWYNRVIFFVIIIFLGLKFWYVVSETTFVEFFLNKFIFLFEFLIKFT